MKSKADQSKDMTVPQVDSINAECVVSVPSFQDGNGMTALEHVAHARVR